MFIKHNSWLALIGKMGICANYSLIFVIASEVFPTEIRSKAVSFGMALSTFGGSVSPLINASSKFGAHYPFVAYGTVSLVALVSSFFIPESKHAPILDTMDDGRQFHHKALEKLRATFRTK